MDWSNAHLEVVTESVLSMVVGYSPLSCQFVERRNPSSVEDIGAVVKAYMDVLRDLEKYFLCESLFLAGSTLTIADIHVACQLMFYRVINIDISQFPQVRSSTRPRVSPRTNQARQLVEWLNRVQETAKGWKLVHEEFEAFVTDCVQKQKLLSSHDNKVKKGKDAAGGNRQPDVYHTVFFQKSPEEVWTVMTQPGGPEWPGGVKEFSEKPGGKFSYLDGAVEGSNLYVQANRKLLQSWRHVDWPTGKSSTVRITAEPEGQNSTQLIMLQQDVPPAFIKKTDELWSAHFWKPMGGVLIRNILQQLFFDNLSPHTLYRLMTDSAICGRLTKTKCEIGRGVGSDISLLDGAITGKNVELVTDVKVRNGGRLGPLVAHEGVSDCSASSVCDGGLANRPHEHSNLGNLPSGGRDHFGSYPRECSCGLLPPHHRVVGQVLLEEDGSLDRRRFFAITKKAFFSEMHARNPSKGVDTS